MQRKRRGRPSTINDDAAVDLTLKRFAPLQDGKPLAPLEELAKQRNLTKSSVSRAIAGAFRRRLVELRAVRRSAPSVDLDVAAELEEAFPHLTAIVVKPEPGAASDGGQASDDLHRALGATMAAYLDDNRPLWKRRSVVGIGSGRAVHYTCKELKRRLESRSERLQAVGVTLVSLTGSMRVRSHAGSTGLVMDADTNLQDAAGCFPDPVFSEPISRSITDTRGSTEPWSTFFEAVKKRRHAEWANPDVPEYARPPRIERLNLAIVGVGVLTHGHSLHQLATGPTEGADPALEPCLDLTISLIQDADRLRELVGRSYFPVVDICNRLDTIPPPEGGKATRSEVAVLLKRLNDTVMRLNRGLLTIPPELLDEADEVILVAGSVEKARAIYKVITQPASNVRYLCTDTGAARSLLSLHGARRPPRR